MSFLEVMIAIGVLAVIVSFVIPSITNVVPASQSATAETNLERLNQAVLKYNHVSEELTTADIADSLADEQTVFTALQTRDANVLGSPFLGSEYSLQSSSSDTAYRAFWNGRMFEMIPVGATGTGLDLLLLQP